MKKTRKVLSVVLAIILTLSILPMSSLTVSAVSAPIIKLIPSHAAAQIGDVISVDITVSENSRLCGLTLDVIYNEEEFEFVDITTEGEFDAEMLNPEYSSHAVRFVGTTTTYIRDEATTIFTVSFRVLENCCDLYVLVKEAYVVNENDENENVTLDTNFLAETITIHESGNENLILAPTCETTGYKTYDCPCGKFVEEMTPATGHNYDDGVCTACGKLAPDDLVTITIQEPSRTTIRNRDGIILHAKVEGDMTGRTIQWSASNDNFKTEVVGNDLKIISDDNGYTTFTASVFNSRGKRLATYSIEMRSKAGLFEKIGGFFRSLFDKDVIYEY